MNSAGDGFGKAERLSKKIIIARLFKQHSHSGSIYPLRLLALTGATEDKHVIPILITVSKKKVRRAVHRNTIKRRLRAAYRHEKRLLYEHHLECKIAALGLIYLADTPLTFELTRTRLKALFEKLVTEIENSRS